MKLTLTHLLVNITLLFILQKTDLTIAEWVSFVTGTLLVDLDRGGGFILQQGRILPMPLKYFRFIKTVKGLDKLLVAFDRQIRQIPLWSTKNHKTRRVGTGYFHNVSVVAVLMLLALLTGSSAAGWFAAGWFLHVLTTAVLAVRVKLFFPFADELKIGIVPADNRIEGLIWIVTAPYLLMEVIF